MMVVFLLQPLRVPLSDSPFEAQIAGKRNLLAESIHRALKRFRHRHALIPELEPWIRKRLDLRHDGGGRLPALTGRFDFRIGPFQFPDKTRKVDANLTLRVWDRLFGCDQSTIFRSTDRPGHKHYDGEDGEKNEPPLAENSR